MYDFVLLSGLRRIEKLNPFIAVFTVCLTAILLWYFSTFSWVLCHTGKQRRQISAQKNRKRFVRNRYGRIE